MPLNTPSAFIDRRVKNKILIIRIACLLHVQLKYMRVTESKFTKTNPKFFSNRGASAWCWFWICLCCVIYFLYVKVSPLSYTVHYILLFWKNNKYHFFFFYRLRYYKNQRWWYQTLLKGLIMHILIWKIYWYVNNLHNSIYCH